MIQIAIIDGDTIVYKAAGACQKKDKETGEMIYEPVSHAYSNARSQLRRILETTKARDYSLYLTESNDKTCFRTALYKDYKANRKDKIRPKYYKEVREYLIKHWKAQVVKTIEADDAVCMEQWDRNKKLGFYDIGTVILDQEGLHNIINNDHSGFESIYLTVVCRIDKDLNQVPGLHYNYNTNEWKYITILEACKYFYMQMLTGDVADNIPRIRFNWGKKKEHKQVKKDLLAAQSEFEAYQVVKKEIERLNKEDGTKQTIDVDTQILFLGNLLYLIRDHGDHYRLPVCRNT